MHGVTLTKPLQIKGPPMKLRTTLNAGALFATWSRLR